MICTDCRTAGNLNERGLTAMIEDKKKAAETCFAQSEFMHDQCRGCDCQHHTRSQTVRVVK
jgi:hypothetical protein